MRGGIERALGIAAFNNYGLSGVIGPGVAGECGERAGARRRGPLVMESLDPLTMEPIPDGAPGELVFTALIKEALPLLRYRTRDLATLDRRACRAAAPRRAWAASPAAPRHPHHPWRERLSLTIEQALLRVEGAAPHSLIEVSRPGAMDEAVVKVEIRPAMFSDEMRQMIALRDRLDHEMHAVTALRMAMESVEPGSRRALGGKGAAGARSAEGERDVTE
jgi:phenylacetate-CoA ligase